ncbi:uncharacterized protein [Setaria viridis]|uniref:uncharacterized protein isoform X1 n=1 Tax=Setaria viridis TaxID=4556 RepID=UPI003B3B5DC5
MGMEEHGRHAEAPSSAFRSFSGSPDEASSLMPGSSTISRRHTPEVSSLKDIPLSPVTFGDHHHYGHSYGNLDDTIQNMEQFRCQESHQEHAQRKNSHCGGAGAFMPYSRHLTTKKQPKPPGSGGQRAIKASMSALARMHMVRLAQWRHCRQMEMAVAPPARSNNCSQLQHVLSERKRREKLNDSFKALTTVLPPSPKVLKHSDQFIIFPVHQLADQTFSERNGCIVLTWQKDKASILIRARDYLNTLKSRVSELEERNRMLVELQRHCNNGVDRDFVSGEEIEVNIDRATTEEISQELHLKIVVRSGCNSMDAVVGILECLKEIGDVRITAMDTGNRASEPPP